MRPAVPKTARAVILENFHSSDALKLGEIRLPPLRSGEVLVRMGAASINPSDLVFLRNQYGIKKTPPVVPGLEGSGYVVAARGPVARALLNRKVACHAPESGNGTWAEYMVCRASACIPLLSTVTVEEGASLIVNPLTAWALMERVKKSGSKAFVQTAAAGALGKMLARLAKKQKIEAIHVVRRREQVESLKTLRCTYVLDSHQEGFEEQLKILCQRLQVGLALDSVGGELTAQLGRCLMPGGKILVYGALAGSACFVSPASLIFEAKSIEGFWLTSWMKQQSIATILRMAYQVQKLLKRELKTDVQARFPLAKIHEAIDLYRKKRSDGKVLLIP
jgi:NADPH:quinone reductase-like Zn-dependent oxidoreductase